MMLQKLIKNQVCNALFNINKYFTSCEYCMRIGLSLCEISPQAGKNAGRRIVKHF